MARLISLLLAPRRSWLLVLAVTILISLAGVFTLPVLDRDEARFAQATVQMLETGDLVRIRFLDEDRHKKPVGIHWIQAAAVTAGNWISGALDGRPDVFHAVGYSGNGVGPSYLAGKILASLALEQKDEWSQCGLVRPLGRDFPPEPMRYFGAKLVRRAIARTDAAADAGRPPGPLTRYLAGFAPAGLSPFKGQKS